MHKILILMALTLSFNVFPLEPISDDELREISIKSDITNILPQCKNLRNFYNLNHYLRTNKKSKCTSVLRRGQLYLSPQEIERIIFEHIQRYLN